MTTVLVIALGAAVGAPLRHLADHALTRRRRSTFPWGTLLVNVIGSAALGLLAGAAANGSQFAGLWLDGLGVGLCGALTTYSTFGAETLRLLDSGAVLQAGLNLLGSAALGIAAAALGATLGRLL